MARWRTRQHLEGHFDRHGFGMGYRSVAEYDASAQETLTNGRYFEYFDDNTGEYRKGCFDPSTNKFVVLTEDFGVIVSHFPADEDYVLGLPYNNYDAEEYD